MSPLTPRWYHHTTSIFKHAKERPQISRNGYSCGSSGTSMGSRHPQILEARFIL
nr:MAG TPA: hypothetical protein [Caudoviricetes sp.]